MCKREDGAGRVVSGAATNPEPERETEQGHIRWPRRPLILSRNAVWRDVVEVGLLIMVIYTLVNLATARAVVEGTSMEPGLETGQLVIVNRSAYFFTRPARGDVIVLYNPRDASEDFIKRVIGLPGETVQILDGRVWVNGTLLDEPYVRAFCQSCDGSWTVGPDEYFVLGDNRRSSHDSHSFGPIKEGLIVGQAWIRYWPLPEFRVFIGPEYGPVNADYIAPPPTLTPTARPFRPAPTGEVLPGYGDTSAGAIDARNGSR
ncbi:MAG: signal peptidase I [Anaerolineae bacterium]|nr:signal peptidase I [Anaerolineae bacterium]